MDREGATEESIDLCKICLKRNSKYTCPRCNITYCSVDCYKSEAHSECSEVFYQEWVESKLKSQTCDPFSRKKMINILKRYQKSEQEFRDNELDSDDDEPLPDISERLKGINLDDSEAVWQKLSIEERRAFEEVLESGEAMKLIPVWAPWWTNKYEVKVEQLECPSTLHFEKEILSVCPPLRKNIPKLYELTKIKPAPNVIFNLLNILGGYALVMRLFNGDYSEFSQLAINILFNISESFSLNKDFRSVDMALEAVIQQGLRNDSVSQYIALAEETFHQIKSDVQKIIDGPSNTNNFFYVQSALSDMHCLFCKKRSPNDKSRRKEIFKRTFSEEFASEIKDISSVERNVCIKRLEYFQSFALDFSFNKIAF